MMLGMDKSATELAALMREQDAFDRGVKVRTSALRDQFAMASIGPMATFSVNKEGIFCTETVAERAYELADAMLAARGGK